MSNNPGVLAIWNDCAAGREQEYERWYRDEHLAERVGIEGFRSGWRYVAVDAEPRYFTHYVTESPATLFSAAYRARLNAPTELTRHVMSTGVFVNASRTECEQRFRSGHSRGSHVVVLRLEVETGPDTLVALARDSAARDEVLRSEVWVASSSPDAVRSTEQNLRPPDTTISACLLVETSDEESARDNGERLRSALPGRVTLGIYRLLVSLVAEDLAGR
ncbi:MAG: hypothetical protein ACI8PT_003841 [Gammaproteobacteria bacterium]|jgi:hypothetical protein